MGFDTIITGGTVVTATDTYPADVAISNGIVVAVGKNLPRENARQIVDAAGQYVMPGGIDVHTHLDMPFGGTSSVDDFQSGTLAAAHGGTTTLVDFAILREGLDTWHAKAEGKAVVDYGFHMIVTDVPPPVLQEMGDLVREGVTSFKV